MIELARLVVRFAHGLNVNALCFIVEAIHVNESFDTIEVLKSLKGGYTLFVPYADKDSEVARYVLVAVLVEYRSENVEALRVQVKSAHFGMLFSEFYPCDKLALCLNLAALVYADGSRLLAGAGNLSVKAVKQFAHVFTHGESADSVSPNDGAVAVRLAHIASVFASRTTAAASALYLYIKVTDVVYIITVKLREYPHIPELYIAVFGEKALVKVKRAREMDFDGRFDSNFFKHNITSFVLCRDVSYLFGGKLIRI